MQEKKKKEVSKTQSVNEKIAYWLDYFNKEKEKSNAKVRHKQDQTDCWYPNWRNHIRLCSMKINHKKNGYSGSSGHSNCEKKHRLHGPSERVRRGGMEYVHSCQWSVSHQHTSQTDPLQAPMVHYNSNFCGCARRSARHLPLAHVLNDDTASPGARRG